MFIFLPIFLHVVRDDLNVAQWTITSMIHDAVYTEWQRRLARELIVSRVMNRNHEKIDRGKKIQEEMKETRKRQIEREIEKTAWKRILAQSERKVRQKIICECLIEAFRKSGERVAFQSLRKEREQKREEIQATRSSAISDRGWSSIAHANLNARELKVFEDCWERAFLSCAPVLSHGTSPCFPMLPLTSRVGCECYRSDMKVTNWVYE